MAILCCMYTVYYFLLTVYGLQSALANARGMLINLQCKEKRKRQCPVEFHYRLKFEKDQGNTSYRSVVLTKKRFSAFGRSGILGYKSIRIPGEKILCVTGPPY